MSWLALLLIRVVENTTGQTWRNVRQELDRMHLVTLATPDRKVAQRTAITAGQKTILTALSVGEPPRFIDFTTTAHPAPPRRHPCSTPETAEPRFPPTAEVQSDEG